ncbi:MAG: nucleoside triphosphate pyrophosphohydrolase [Alcanivoracaceae bacterium]|nr:nucleoside triphosphate pyrophosphohydrolase [Alcanivoracaceae bacterium]
MMESNINQLLDTMAQLRDKENGCPWDIEQSFNSLSSYTVEEAYEVVDAIDKGDYQHLKEELGDLLFQVVFYAQIASEQGLFNFNDIVNNINDKMIERHPHVFDTNNQQKHSAIQMSKIWEQNKLRKRKKADCKQYSSVLDDIPNNLPELLKAVKLTKRAAVIGFDWPSIEPVFTKMEEEIAELKEAMQMGVTARIKDELGDVLFVCTNLARHLRLDPQLALRHANNKFEKRFRAIESAARNTYPKQDIYDLKTLEDLWIEVKKVE